MSYVHREQDMHSVPDTRPAFSSSFTMRPAALKSLSTIPLADRVLPLISLNCPSLLPTTCQWCGLIGHSRHSSKHCLKRKVVQEDEHQSRPIPSRSNRPFYPASSFKSSSTYFSPPASRTPSVSLSQSTFTPQSISPSRSTFTPPSISPSASVSGLQSFPQSQRFSTPPSPLVPEIRVFGTAIAAFRTPDDTTYNSLGRMDVPCSDCGAMHWIEVHLVFIYAWALFSPFVPCVLTSI